jgi:hypothetical protein
MANGEAEVTFVPLVAYVLVHTEALATHENRTTTTAPMTSNGSKQISKRRNKKWKF